MSITLNNAAGDIIAGGGDGSDGDIILRNSASQNRIRLDGAGGNAWLGGNGSDGDLVLFSTGGDNVTLAQATIHLNGQAGNINAGGNGTDGDIILRDGAGQNRIRLDAGGGNAWLGGNGADGDLVLFANDGDNQTLAQATIHLNGQAGDIILQNADCAEDFQVMDRESLDPGTVVVIGEDSTLKRSHIAYDKRVAGIIAGAADLRPGIILGRKSAQKNRLPVALMGRVYCKVDASFGALKIGDLLTTSPNPGHAMKASNPIQAFGAVIGKALTGLREGTGMVPVLVALQ